MWRFIVIYLFAILATNCTDNVDNNLAVNFFLEGNWQNTFKAASNWVTKDSDNPIPHAILNLAYTQLGDRVNLKKELRLAYGTRDNTLKVINWSSELINKNPNNPRAWLLNGLAHEEFGEDDSAQKSYLNSIKVDPAFKQGYESLGHFYLSINPDKALLFYSKLIEIDSNYSGAYVNIANVYIVKNNLSIAIQNLEKAVSLNPENVVALHNLASAYLQIEKTDQAIQILKKIVELDPYGEVGHDAKNSLSQL